MKTEQPNSPPFSELQIEEHRSLRLVERRFDRPISPKIKEAEEQLRNHNGIYYDFIYYRNGSDYTIVYLRDHESFRDSDEAWGYITYTLKRTFYSLTDDDLDIKRVREDLYLEWISIMTKIENGKIK